MSNIDKNVYVGFVLVCNFAGTVVLTVFAWMSSIWMTGKWAWNWTSHDWASAALQRASYWIAIAAVVGLIAAVINRFLLARLFPHQRYLPWVVGGVDGLVIALGGIVGSIQFFIEKPYM